MGVLILGTGGHGKVALDILLESGFEVQGFLDDDESKHGQEVHGYRVIGSIKFAAKLENPLAMGIGSNQVRKNLAEMFPDAEWVPMIHPTAIVSRFARVGRGVMIGMGVCIQPDAVIGDFAVINTGATVDHDCVVGAFAHVSVGCTLAGGVTVGEGALLGAGTCTKPNVHIGSWSVIGAGAAVVRNVPSQETWVGVPARPK